MNGSNKPYCDLAEFKIAFILCIAILAIYSTLSTLKEGDIRKDANSRTVSTSIDSNMEVTGFIKREGASGFTASSKVPEWAKRAN